MKTIARAAMHIYLWQMTMEYPLMSYIAGINIALDRLLEGEQKLYQAEYFCIPEPNDPLIVCTIIGEVKEDIK